MPRPGRRPPRQRAYLAPRAAVRALRAADPRLDRLFGRLPEIRIPQRPSSFATLARAIVYQQLTGKAARTIYERLEARLGGGGLTPDAVLGASHDDLRAAGLSAAKARAVTDLAEHVADGRLAPEDLHALDDAEVEAALVQVRGIGPWSAHMHLMFSLGRLDVWPTGDLGVRKGLARLLGRERVEPTEAEQIGAPWRPWRSVAAFAMWRILELPEGD